MHRRQEDLLEIHPCVLQDLPRTFQAFQPQDLPKAFQTFQTFQSFQTFQPLQAILQVPAFPGNPPHSSILQLECIFYIFTYSTNSTVQLVSTENSTKYQLDNTNYKHSTNITFFKRKGDVVILVNTYWLRCQDDIFSRIELFPSNVLSSEKAHYKNDIQ